MELRVFLQILLYYLLVLFGCLSAVPLGMTTVNNFPLSAIMLTHYKIKNWVSVLQNVCFAGDALCQAKILVSKSVTSISLVFKPCQVCL